MTDKNEIEIILYKFAKEYFVGKYTLHENDLKKIVKELETLLKEREKEVVRGFINWYIKGGSKQYTDDGLRGSGERFINLEN